jgi:glyoxylase-like metal-dependent hydrolase (beta-lactamase superfamily II)
MAMTLLRLLVSLLWVCAPALALAQDDLQAPLQVKQVSKSAWYAEGLSAAGSPGNQNFISNAGFVITPVGVVVIDALGSPKLAERLLAAIARITPLPVTHVVATHYHADHIYGLQVFKAAGARIVAQKSAQIYLSSDAAQQRLEASRAELAPWIDAKTRLVPPDQWLDDKLDLTLGGMRVQIRAAGPAHTPEDLVIFLVDEKVLFAGDLVFRNRIPFVGQADSGRWINALDELLAFNPMVIVPGHGPASTSAVDDVKLTRDYLTHLRKAMGGAARNMDPFDAAYDNADWSRFQNVPMFRFINRMNAYNTYLLLERAAP